ncbi:MAG: hypothetical protein Q9170_007780, partial [Blastenia crenularia]
MDPEAFYNNTEGHRMSYVYQFEYYNHRLDKRMRVDSKAEYCLTEDSADDTYFHNKCLSWEDQAKDFCGKFVFHNLPAGVENQTDWEFCYRFHGDVLVNKDHVDEFSFDGDKRELVRTRDWIEDKEVVKTRCGKLCDQERGGMELFESRYGGWFNRIDSFH